MERYASGIDHATSRGAQHGRHISRISGDNTPAVLLVTYGNRAIDDTLIELADAVSERGCIPVAGCAMAAHHSLMVNVAEGRPDADDLAVLDTCAASVVERLGAAATVRDAELGTIPGNRPYRAFGGVPFHPEAAADVCVSCGACAAQCPVRAIDPAAPSTTDIERCISCMRCIAACPVGARAISGGDALAAARTAFAEKCAQRQESYTVM